MGGGWRLLLCVGAVGGGGEVTNQRALLRQWQGRGRHRANAGLWLDFLSHCQDAVLLVKSRTLGVSPRDAVAPRGGPRAFSGGPL